MDSTLEETTALPAIKRLSTDVLYIVFKLYLIGKRGDLGQDVRKLGQVCQLWQSVVQTHPLLWAELFIALKSTPGLLPLLQDALQWSGTSPLRIYVQNPFLLTGKGSEELSAQLQEASSIVFPQLLLHSARWTHFIFWGPAFSSFPTTFVSLSDQAPIFPKLRRLKLGQFTHLPLFFNHLDELLGLDLRRDVSLSALSTRAFPNLRRLHAEGLTITPGQMDPLSNTSADFISCFRAFRRLENVSFVALPTSKDTPPPNEKYCARHLRKMTLRENIQLLQYLELPSLRKLCLYGLSKRALPMLPSLLACAPSLLYLTVEPVHTLSWLFSDSHPLPSSIHALEITLPNTPCPMPDLPDQVMLPELWKVHLNVTHSFRSTLETRESHREVAIALSQLLRSKQFPSFSRLIISAAITGTETEVNGWKEMYLRLQEEAGGNAIRLVFTGRMFDGSSRKGRNHANDVVELPELHHLENA